MRSAFGRESKRLFTSVALVVGFAGPGFAQSLPTGGAVAAGAATIATPSGTSLVVTQTSRNAIINWRSFSVGQGNAVAFQNGSGATLNRVTGNVPSRLDGTITATGSLFLVNPAGVTIGTAGRIATGGSFLASTLDVPDADFMKGGDLTFKGASTASVVNYGEIGSLGGDVALIARKVENAGTIDAPNGTAALAAGYEVLVKDGNLDGGKFVVKVGGADTEAKTSGKIRAAAAELRANGGNVYALAGNTDGVIAATGTAKKGGRIFLTAGDGGTVEVRQKVVARAAASGGKAKGGAIRVSGKTVAVSGTLDAKGDGDSGGSIVVSGSAITLASSARLDASGTIGGTVLVGGDFQGGKNAATNYLTETVATAKTVDVASGATIAADGSVGAGGKVVVWSDEHTTFQGAITATGVTVGGDVEVSGKAVLDYRGTADLRSATGRFGTLLLDPYNLTISTGADTGMTGFTASADNSVLNVNTLTAALANANVTVTTGSGGTQAGNITVAAPITWSSGSILTLSAYGNIAVNADITGGSTSSLVLRADSTGTGRGSVKFRPGTVATAAGGVSIFYNPSSYTAPIDYSANAGASTTITAYMLVNDVDQLQATNTNLAGTYALGKDIDASATATWNGGAGFVPIGDNTTQFTGTFDGEGHVISGLMINRPDTDYVGLFGHIGAGSAVTDLGLDGGTVTGRAAVGALAGQNSGTIERAYASSDVTGSNSYTGGLVGLSAGAMSHVYATGTVVGRGAVGGLAGSSSRSISDAYATGSVTGTQFVGGLLGQNTGSVSQSYATGAVTGTNTYIGGLSGYNTGTLIKVYATGAVRGIGSVGGLVGQTGGGSITNAYATGSVTGTGDNVGGLVGTAFGGTISQTYVSGPVAGGNYVGGLLGSDNSATITASFFDTTTTGQTNGVGNSLSVTGVTGLTTAQARQASNYTGWDFVTDWYQAGDMRPIGRWEAAQPDTSGVATLTNAHQLVLINTNLSGSYVLGSDVDASETAGTNAAGVWGVAGFVPIGDNSTVSSASQFAGIFDGQGHKIQGLTINVTGSIGGYYGLFGYTGSASAIKNLLLEGGSVQVSGSNGALSVGMLAGKADGTVTGVTTTGTVDVTNTGNFLTYAGGLTGQSSGAVSDSEATGAVTASGGYDSYAGGLVGWATGNLTGVHASGTVDLTAGRQGWAGGLAGRTSATIATAYATGAVTVHAGTVGAAYGGGLIGQAGAAVISSVYATGTVQATSLSGASAGAALAGGLIGLANSVSLSSAYATGAVSTNTSGTNGAFSGGLVGWQLAGSITTAYAHGSATSTSTSGSSAGGLVAYGTGSISQAYATGAADATSSGYYSAYASVFAGGLVARSFGPVSQTYATGFVTASTTVSGQAYTGGLIGSMSGTLSASYFDLDTTNQTYGVGSDTTAAGGTGLTTVQMQDGSTTADGFYALASAAGWDFAIDWARPNAVAAQSSDNQRHYAEFYSLNGVIGANASATMTYGGTVPTLTPTYSGLGGTAGNTVTTAPTFSTSATSTSNVGTYAVTGSGGAGVNAAGQSLRFVYSGAVTVNQASLTVTANDASKTYDGLAFSGGNGVTYTGFVNGETASVLGGTLTYGGTSQGAINAGTYAITASGLTSGNYAITYVDGALSVAKASLTVTANDASKTYDGLAFSGGNGVTYTGFVNGETASVLGGSLTYGGTSQGAINAGTYAITASGLTSGNYAITYVDGALSVAKASLSVTANDASKTYDGLAFSGGNGVTYTGFVNGETASVLGGSLTYGGNSQGAINAGTYGITTSGLTSGNYAITYQAGSLAIGQRAITVAADNQSMSYGDGLPGLTWSVTSGSLVNGDTLSGALATTASSAANVGTYAITQGTLAASANYAVTYVDGALTVTPRAITVAANDAAMVAGSAVPPLGWSITSGSLVGGDSLSGALMTAATSGSPAGPYAILQGTLGASANYTLAYVPGTLTVTAAPVPPNNGGGTSDGGGTANGGDTGGGTGGSGVVAGGGSTAPIIAAGTPPVAVIATLAATPNRFVETSASNATVVFTTSTTSPFTVTGGESGGTATQASGGSANGGTTEDSGSGCTGGATSSAACTATPHPENRRVGRFLTFSAAAPVSSLTGPGTTTLQ